MIETSWFLQTPSIAELPPWIIALVVAGALEAALSNVAGLLLVISVCVSHDLIKKTFATNINEKKELFMLVFRL
jgi:Predicted symporter